MLKHLYILQKSENQCLQVLENKIVDKELGLVPIAVMTIPVLGLVLVVQVLTFVGLLSVRKRVLLKRRLFNTWTIIKHLVMIMVIQISQI